MPAVPPVSRERSICTINTDQMRHEGAYQHLSPEEEIAAEESLTVYCKPVELYNIIRRRAITNPSFLQRSLQYKIHAKHKRRLQMTFFLSGSVNGDMLTHTFFPVYILLARLVSVLGNDEYSAMYHFSRACVLTNFVGVDGSSQAQACFILPTMNKLGLEVKAGSLYILLISFAGAESSMHGFDLTKGHMENIGGCCLLGRLPLESPYASWNESPNLVLGQRVQLTTLIDMQSGFLKLSCSDKDKYVLVQIPQNHESSNTLQLQVDISVEEVGAKENNLYHSHARREICSLPPHVFRLRAGNVIFNYRYFNNKLQKTEVTEDFCCAFCLVKCISFKGLRYHLLSSHDLFSFEFWVTEEFQAVNVSVKLEKWTSEVVAGSVDPKQQTFFYRSKKPRYKRLNNLSENKKCGHSFIFESNLNPSDNVGFDKDDDDDAADGERLDVSNHDIARVSDCSVKMFTDHDCVQSLPGSNYTPPTMLQFAKTRKLSVERSEMRNRTLLCKRQFFHSHRAQPMSIEQVLSDRDSEDEVDDDVADFEDRRMLDDFVDVTKDEKLMMHLWNSFVRKQRVLADGHVPWACEAFSRLHGHEMAHNPSLMWCWKLFMIKLWNHGLLDANTMNTCSIILEQCQKQDPIPNDTQAAAE